MALGLDQMFPDDKRILNLCDQPFSMMKSFAKILGVPQEILRAKYFGLNHFGSILPETIEKVVYMDCDVLVLQSLRDLWNTPMENKMARKLSHRLWLHRGERFPSSLAL